LVASRRSLADALGLSGGLLIPRDCARIPGPRGNPGMISRASPDCGAARFGPDYAQDQQITAQYAYNEYFSRRPW
jgi:hypothetical protein